MAQTDGATPGDGKGDGNGDAQSDGERDREERARRLFEEGYEAVDRGDSAAACAKFEESLALFRRASTLLNLGACHEKLGHTASALRYWSEGSALLPSDDARMAMAKERVAELEQKVPRLIVRLPTPLPAMAVVTLDGRELTQAELAEPLQLDPGPHHLRLAAPGYLPSEVVQEFHDGERREVPLLLTPLEVKVAPAPTPDPVASTGVPNRPSDAAAEHRIPLWVWPVGGVGLVVAAVSIPFAVDYDKTVSRQHELCGGELTACRPSPPGSYDPADDNVRKRRDAIAAAAFGATGGLLVVAAIVGAVVGEDVERDAALRVEPGPGSLTVAGRF